MNLAGKNKSAAICVHDVEKLMVLLVHECIKDHKLLLNMQNHCWLYTFPTKFTQQVVICPGCYNSAALQNHCWLYTFPTKFTQQVVICPGCYNSAALSGNQGDRVPLLHKAYIIKHYILTFHLHQQI